MASSLRLQVILDGIDKASGPFKRIAEQSRAMRESLKSSREALRALEKTQGNIVA